MSFVGRLTNLGKGLLAARKKSPSNSDAQLVLDRELTAAVPDEATLEKPHPPEEEDPAQTQGPVQKTL